MMTYYIESYVQYLDIYRDSDHETVSIDRNDAFLIECIEFALEQGDEELCQRILHGIFEMKYAMSKVRG